MAPPIAQPPKATPRPSTLAAPTTLDDTQYEVRNLRADDYHRGHLQCLEQLTMVGKVSESDYIQTFNSLYTGNTGNSSRIQLVTSGKFRIGEYTTIVIVRRRDDRIVGSGTLFLERKFIHQAGLLGHIEDIVVDGAERGKNLGLYLVRLLGSMAEQAGCYKVTLDCSQHNEKFYERAGFQGKGLQMALYFD